MQKGLYFNLKTYPLPLRKPTPRTNTDNFLYFSLDCIYITDLLVFFLFLSRSPPYGNFLPECFVSPWMVSAELGEGSWCNFRHLEDRRQLPCFAVKLQHVRLLFTTFGSVNRTFGTSSDNGMLNISIERFQSFGLRSLWAEINELLFIKIAFIINILQRSRYINPIFSVTIPFQHSIQAS